MIHIIIFVLSWIMTLSGFLSHELRISFFILSIISLINATIYLYKNQKTEVEKMVQSTKNPDWNNLHTFTGKYEDHVEDYCPFLKNYSLVYFDDHDETKTVYCPTSLMSYLSKENDYKVFLNEYSIVVHIEGVTKKQGN